MSTRTALVSMTHHEYTIGWVCALPKEQTAAKAMLDHIHQSLPKSPNDPNTYTLGSIGKHNIVIACLPKGRYGNSSAATVATQMARTFPSLKVGLMVGIGGGIPPKVRLGDVVVSTPTGQFPGVVQWDLGKAIEGGNFERTGSLDNPPSSLLTAITTLETQHEMAGSRIPEYLRQLAEKYPKLAQKYLRAPSLEDVLFKASYSHVNSQGKTCEENQEIHERDRQDDVKTDDEEYDEEVGKGCRFCDKAKTVKRNPRDMLIHYGLIASGNKVIKDAALRDRLNKELGGAVLCVEMEAAGLLDFPCIVIRGICDYADSHKNKNWQEHAAAVAAAFAKELLEQVQPTDVAAEMTVKENLTYNFSHSSLGPSIAYVPRLSLSNKIREQLCNNDTEGHPKILVVWGLGGVGKTQLVLDYAQRHRSEYRGTFWVESGRRESLERDFINIYRTIFGAQPDAEGEPISIDTAVIGVKSWFNNQRRPCLMVFDGADAIENEQAMDYIDIKHFIPNVHQGPEGRT